MAGLSTNVPSSVNREPWQGQSHECSVGFHFRAQPICGHRGAVGVSRLIVDSRALIKSCGFNIVRDGENMGAYGCPFPSIISRKIMAAAMEDVIPHLWKPVAT